MPVPVILYDHHRYLLASAATLDRLGTGEASTR